MIDQCTHISNFNTHNCTPEAQKIQQNTIIKSKLRYLTMVSAFYCPFGQYLQAKDRIYEPFHKLFTC